MPCCAVPSCAVLVCYTPRTQSACTLQVKQEADNAFVTANQEPSRDAADDMQYTLACLKVSQTRNNAATHYVVLNRHVLLSTQLSCL